MTGIPFGMTLHMWTTSFLYFMINLYMWAVLIYLLNLLSYWRIRREGWGTSKEKMRGKPKVKFKNWKIAIRFISFYINFFKVAGISPLYHQFSILYVPFTPFQSGFIIFLLLYQAACSQWKRVLFLKPQFNSAISGVNRMARIFLNQNNF